MPKPSSAAGGSTRKSGEKTKTRAPAKSAASKTATTPSEAEAVQQQLPEIFTVTKLADGKRRDRCHSRFNELSELVLTTEVNPARLAAAPDFFPTLQVGFMARAMGLELSNDEVIQLVSLVEEDAPSQGAVSRTRLEGVLVEAVMTGLLGGPTLATSGLVPEARLSGFRPVTCVRTDEATIFRAFTALDSHHRGYLDEAQLREYFASGSEPFGDEEMEDLLLAILDPETNVAYFKDFADVLAHE